LVGLPLSGAEGGEGAGVINVDGGSTAVVLPSATRAASGSSRAVTTGSTTVTASTASTASAPVTTTTLPVVDEAGLDLEELLLLALTVAGLFPGLASEVIAVLVALVEGPGIGPLLVLAGSLVGTTDVGGSTKVGLLGGKLRKVLVVGLGLLLLLNGGSLLALGGSGLTLASLLLGDLLTSKLVIPFARALGGTPALVGLLVGVAVSSS
jgi:hypothetical protein